VALWFLWKEHSRVEKTEAEAEAEEGEAAEAEAADEASVGPEAASVEGWDESAADAGAGPRHSATHRPDMREIYVVLGLLGHSVRHSHPDVLGPPEPGEGGKGSPANHTRRAALAKSSFGR